MMEFNKVLNGIVKYIDKEIMHNLNSWQEVLARISMSRAINNSQGIKDFITKKVEAPIDASNVMILDPKTKVPTRIGYTVNEKGVKVRVTKKSGTILD